MKKICWVFYVSGHPLGKYSKLIKTYSSHSVLDVFDITSSRYVKTGGIITAPQFKNTKKGDRFAIFNLEDLDSNIECLAFPRAFEKCKSLIEENRPVFIVGLVKRNDDDDENTTNKIIVDDIIEVEKAYELYTKEIHIKLHEGSKHNNTLSELKSILVEYPGESPTILCITAAGGEIAYIETSGDFNVRVNEELIHKIKHMLGEDCYRLKADLTLPVFKQRKFKKPQQQASAG